ncbi:MAG: hypothetical protein JZU64_06860 [Rhodoferax sp.]|nr:hypothetical protein [Rhodoferax sp.]
MLNPYAALLALLPGRPLQVGTVTAVDNGQAIVMLPGGGLITARGSAYVDQQVFVRDGVIEGTATTLPVEIIDV